jgi:hypothetical protein
MNRLFVIVLLRHLRRNIEIAKEQIAMAQESIRWDEDRIKELELSTLQWEE